MKILKKAITPDGVEIQIEDWSDTYSFYPYGSLIGAYPKKILRVRAECQFKNHLEALKTFDDLVIGKTTVFNDDFTVMDNGGNRIPLTKKLENLKNQYSI